MTIENKTDALSKFIIQPQPDISIKQLEEAIYAMTELCLWPDNIDNISVEQVLKCWALVETLTKKDFPHSLNV